MNRKMQLTNNTYIWMTKTNQVEIMIGIKPETTLKKYSLSGYEHSMAMISNSKINYNNKHSGTKLRFHSSPLAACVPIQSTL